MELCSILGIVLDLESRRELCEFHLVVISIKCFFPMIHRSFKCSFIQSVPVPINVTVLIDSYISNVKSGNLLPLPICFNTVEKIYRCLIFGAFFDEGIIPLALVA